MNETNSFVKRIFIKDDKLTTSDKISLINNTETESIINPSIPIEYTNKQFIIETKESKQIIKKEKERKMRVETKTWGLNTDDLSFDTQLQLLQHIYTNIFNSNSNSSVTLDTHLNPKHISMITSHIKAKISGYKQQDVIKNRLNDNDFVSFIDVIKLLYEANMKCHYCACETYLLYEIVRETKQWSLDRINNNIGHNRNNLLNACLECNLKRRRTNKDAFLFTKNLKIVRLD
jgi:hypothetical protein